MAKATEGPYTALPGEEPVKVKPDILEVPIRKKGERAPGQEEEVVRSPSSSTPKSEIEGPYTALPGEEPVKVESGILEVPIRNKGITPLVQEDETSDEFEAE
jgi:hypothetical protein